MSARIHELGAKTLAVSPRVSLGVLALKSTWECSTVGFMMRHLALLLLLSAGDGAAEQRITIGSGARVRSEPNLQGREVVKLGIGTVLHVVETRKVGDMVWHRVKAESPVEVDGWMSAGLSAEYVEARRDEIALNIARQRLASSPVWADDRDAVSYLARAAATTGEAGRDASKIGEISLIRLLLMQRSFGLSAPANELEAWAKKTPAAHYDVVGGAWMVPSSEFWALHDTVRDSSIAERIAFEAAGAPTPGECEGSVVCVLTRLSSAEGRYLELYPKTANAPEIAQRFLQTLVNVKELTPEDAEHGEISVQLGRLKKMLSGLNAKLKGPLLEALRPLEPGRTKRGS